MRSTVTCLGALAYDQTQKVTVLGCYNVCTLAAAELPTKYACDNAPDLERDIVRSASSVSVGMTVAPVRETNMSVPDQIHVVVSLQQQCLLVFYVDRRKIRHGHEENKEANVAYIS